MIHQPQQVVVNTFSIPFITIIIIGVCKKKQQQQIYSMCDYLFHVFRT